MEILNEIRQTAAPTGGNGVGESAKWQTGECALSDRRLAEISNNPWKINGGQLTFILDLRTSLH